MANRDKTNAHHHRSAGLDRPMVEANPRRYTLHPSTKRVGGYLNWQDEEGNDVGTIVPKHGCYAQVLLLEDAGVAISLEVRQSPDGDTVAATASDAATSGTSSQCEPYLEGVLAGHFLAIKADSDPADAVLQLS